MNLFKKNKGETLIELLASIAILSIVIVVFLRAITTLVTINNKTESKLDANYMAERIMEYMNLISDISISGMEKKLNEATEFDCTEISSSNPYKFKVIYDDYSALYAIIEVNHKYYTELGNMSRVTVTVYNTDDSEITSYDSALYWK